METTTSNRQNSALKSLISESKKIRSERGEDFFANKKIEAEKLTTQIPLSSEAKETSKDTSNAELEKIRQSHALLSTFVSEYDQKIFDQDARVLNTKKTRSKSIHLYIDEKIEHFLKSESQKAETKWGLRKNAGLGNLIQKFILNFIELKKREERQLKRVKKVIDEFQVHLVEFKKYSPSPLEVQKAEIANQKMKTLSNDLNILLSLLEFEEGALKSCLNNDQFRWMEFVLKWKKISS